MFLGRVKGHVVATQKDPSVIGAKLLIVEPLKVAYDQHATAGGEPTAQDPGGGRFEVTGLGKGAEGTRDLRVPNGRTVRAVFRAFSDDIGTLLSAADLVISRAGAGTLAELVQCGTPAILVPYPHAADNHQQANARYFEAQGGGLVAAALGLTATARLLEARPASALRAMAT